MTTARLDPAVAAPPATRPALITLLALYAVTTAHHLYGDSRSIRRTACSCPYWWGSPSRPP